MGFVIVISLPLILFSILMGFGCYFYGKRKGREEMRTGVGSQVYGIPLPPHGTADSSPSPVKYEKERVNNVWADYISLFVWLFVCLLSRWMFLVHCYFLFGVSLPSNLFNVGKLSELGCGADEMAYIQTLFYLLIISD